MFDKEPALKRLTMSLDDDLAEAFDAIAAERGDENRSEAFRDLLLADLGHTHQAEHPKGPGIDHGGTLPASGGWQTSPSPSSPETR